MNPVAVPCKDESVIAAAEDAFFKYVRAGFRLDDLEELRRRAEQVIGVPARLVGRGRGFAWCFGDEQITVLLPQQDGDRARVIIECKRTLIDAKFAQCLLMSLIQSFH